ncbi:MAG: hypothetical protein JWO87_2693 [Phycisphaerales bacterium]|nr:hypothetical protein [Phycisphaerales bacterium]
MWITILTIDVIECTLALTATHDPERQTPAVEFAFGSVGAVRIDRYHAPDHMCLGDFEGVEEKKLGQGRSEFRVNTGDAFVVFEAASDYTLKRHKAAPDS